MTDLLVHTFLRGREEPSAVANRMAYGNLASVVCILCNLLLFAGKFTVGTLFGSIAIAADAINNLSDASGNIISLVGFKLGARPADPEHPYGHARYEYLAGLAVSVMILVIGIELGKESFLKILHPSDVNFSILMIVVLFASILVKLWMSLFNRKIGTLISSETLMATAADSRNDVISTAAVLAATLITRFTGVAMVDGIMGLLVALFILYSGIGLVHDTLSPILGGPADAETVARIQKKVMSYPGVLGIHDLMIHDYGPGNRFATLHVEMAAEGDVMASHDLIDNIERDCMQDENLFMTIHFDPIVTSDPHVAELRGFLSEEAVKIDPQFTIHDVRIVPGPTHTNVVFDCVTPAGCARPVSEIRRDFQRAVEQKWPDHICVVKMEISYTSLPEQAHEEP